MAAARFDPAAITASLDRAAELGGDITVRVYANLFARYPDMRPLFVRDTTGAVKGEMLARVIEAIQDFIGARAYADHLIETEAVTHEGYGVPREIFPAFFGTLADTLREILGREWTAEIDASWRSLLAELDVHVRRAGQPASA